MNGGRQGYQKSDLELPWQHGMKARQGEARLPEAQVPFPSRSGEGVGNIIGAGFAEVLAGCGAFEWVALGYLVVSSVLIVIFSVFLVNRLPPLTTLFPSASLLVDG